ncbi:hypothetical protein ACN6UQ_003426 [Cronobacter muytjensii]
MYVNAGVMIKSLIIFFLLIVLTGEGMAFTVNENGCYHKRYNKYDGVHSLYGTDQAEEDCAYYYSDTKNEVEKIKRKVLFNISINKVSNDLYALAHIINKSEVSLYVWKGDFFPLKKQLSGDFFNLISEKVRMDYLGAKVNFGAAPDSYSDFIEIVPGGEIKERIKLNEYYHFLPGQHSYNVGTISIPFIRKLRTGEEYATPENAFWVRSNRIIITVDGNDIKDTIAQFYTVE